MLIAWQLGQLPGLSISASDPIPQIVELIDEISNTSVVTLAVSAVEIAALLLLRRFVPNFPDRSSW